MEYIGNKKKQGSIVELLRDEILAGNIPDGREMTQNELAEGLGVSRMPVREALILLEYQGLIDRLPNNHVRVASLTEDYFRHILKNACSLEIQFLQNLREEELEELLRELRLKTPDEIKRYQKIISNKDAILADAQNKADAIIAEAQAKAREMVEQSEVMQSAYAQANETVNNANQQAQEILDAATNDANSIRLGAIGYTDDMLANLSNIMTTALNDAGEKYNSFVESLTSCYNTVVQNRSELSPQGAPEEEQPEEEVVVPEYDPASEEESEEE